MVSNFILLLLFSIIIIILVVLKGKEYILKEYRIKYEKGKSRGNRKKWGENGKVG